eukprot:4681238-Amphidinium_carterae.1
MAAGHSTLKGSKAMLGHASVTRTCYGSMCAVDSTSPVPRAILLILLHSLDQSAVLFTDSRSAYDSLSQTRPSLSGVNRKTALRSSRWLPHHRHLADGLTKAKGNVNSLIEVLTHGSRKQLGEPIRDRKSPETSQRDDDGDIKFHGKESGPECEAFASCP